MAVNIEKMVYLKQKKIINVFYISLLIAMMLALLTIYLVRVYIHKQLKKHAIHDHDTHLFNQKYFLAELHTTVERAKRENNPLSMLFVSIDNFSTGQYDDKQQKHLAQKIAHILSIITRDSDLVCRFDNNHFTILMALTAKGEALHLEKRIKDALEAYDFHTMPKPEFSFNTTQFENSETEESFIARSKN
jgi:diguanylate cyclase (GGDEF)-like protein